MIRVLHVFNTFNQGGIENFVMNVYRNIDREKFQFDFAFRYSQKGYFDDEAKLLGGNIYYFDSDKLTLANYYKSLKRIIKENGPYDVVHSHIYYFSGYILWIAKKMGVPIRIAHSHETKKGRKENVVRKIYETLMVKLIKMNSTNMLCCSDMAGAYVFGKDINYEVLYNGIDLNRFRYDACKRNKMRKQLGIENEEVFLCVGRFADQKNHKFLIKVFEKYVNKHNNTKLILIGGGPLLYEIKSNVNEKNLNDKVIFLSNIGNTEDYYNAADVFLLPSKYEGMGIVVIEAQATGLPTIVSDAVPNEVDVTDSIRHLSIDEGVDNWIRELENTVIYENRLNSNKLFLSTPFNIKYTVDRLSSIYSGNK